MMLTDEWVIQLAVRSQMAAQLDVESGQRHFVPWAGYTRPMTGDQAVRALQECETRWPGYEFRACRLDATQKLRARMVFEERP